MATGGKPCDTSPWPSPHSTHLIRPAATFSPSDAEKEFILWDDDPGRCPGFFPTWHDKKEFVENGAEVKLEIFGNCGMLAGT
jgi:hypothetical protein